MPKEITPSHLAKLKKNYETARAELVKAKAWVSRMASELNTVLSDSPAPPPRTAAKLVPAKRAVADKRNMDCIAPGCTNRSRGPRYRFLCGEHEKASEAQVKKWRKERARG